MGMDPVARGLAVVELLQQERFEEVCELFAPELAAHVSTEVLGPPWKAMLQSQGPIAEVGAPVADPADAATTVRLPVRCERGGFAVIVAVDGRDRLLGLRLGPIEAAAPLEPWATPDYVHTEGFTESEVTVGDGPLAVPGTLALPTSPGPLPAVVLLAGSGPADRDGTIGRNKVLKDLAWGLASRGIATLRFDKVTYTHRDAHPDDPTLAYEYVNDAVAAVALLRAHPSIDSGRILVLGHSEGGMVAPRIAAADPSVAGLVILAGSTQPLHHTMIRQIRYLASLRPDADVDADPSVREITRQAAVIDGPDFSAATPADDLPFGVPASYWIDLLAYDPAATAAALTIPMFIAQGGRDYQVTVADDLPAWRAALSDRDDVTIRVYEPDNHLFFPGSGPSTPAEYEPAQHVDPELVADIAEWIASR
ncbi:alpha/beta hydrolase [Nocardia sp. NEAU-G5]|uniref:Alpha/beta hydrolase n=1 Tax=Nocardia albiluteola TaxID=2842303 RepID=A0ABS6BDS9_9NOCA|nr:alpha/beta hydrolase [Nocardia albiluteola]MBU3067393.1 alpha/beta hydrolase [Nocardia albiluteola]